ncbi:MAG: hypothetical protein ACR2LQ_05490 [Acidimicrobiales bacterium]
MPGARFEVEEVSGRVAFRTFHELPHVLLREEPRWSAPLAAWDRARLDPQRNPFFVKGDAAYFILRHLGRPAGRITAHIAADDDLQGWFGFYDVIDDAAGTAALVEAAAAWLLERGCTSMTGPASFTLDDELGVLVSGFDVPGTTGRPWHPPWYGETLVAAGLEEVAGTRRGSWRLPATGGAQLNRTGAIDVPELVGPYGDRRLLLAGPTGSIAGVPDLTVARGSALALARRAKRGEWESCTVVRCEGNPAELVPGLQAAAGEAGYAWVVAAWSPDPRAAPEAEHATFTTSL